MGISEIGYAHYIVPGCSTINDSLGFKSPPFLISFTMLCCASIICLYYHVAVNNTKANCELSTIIDYAPVLFTQKRWALPASYCNNNKILLLYLMKY